MKQEIAFITDNSIRDFIMAWKFNKGYGDTHTLTVGECMELLIAITPNLHVEYSDGRFFNKSLINSESSIQWEGEELIDILFYEIEQNIKARIGRQGTFND